MGPLDKKREESIGYIKKELIQSIEEGLKNKKQTEAAPVKVPIPPIPVKQPRAEFTIDGVNFVKDGVKFVIQEPTLNLENSLENNSDENDEENETVNTVNTVNVNVNVNGVPEDVNNAQINYENAVAEAVNEDVEAVNEAVNENAYENVVAEAVNEDVNEDVENAVPEAVNEEEVVNEENEENVDEEDEEENYEPETRRKRKRSDSACSSRSGSYSSNVSDASNASDDDEEEENEEDEEERPPPPSTRSRKVAETTKKRSRKEIAEIDEEVERRPTKRSRKEESSESEEVEDRQVITRKKKGSKGGQRDPYSTLKTKIAEAKLASKPHYFYTDIKRYLIKIDSSKSRVYNRSQTKIVHSYVKYMNLLGSYYDELTENLSSLHQPEPTNFTECNRKIKSVTALKASAVKELKKFSELNNVDGLLDPILNYFNEKIKLFTDELETLKQLREPISTPKTYKKNVVEKPKPILKPFIISKSLEEIESHLTPQITYENIVDFFYNFDTLPPTVVLDEEFEFPLAYIEQFEIPKKEKTLPIKIPVDTSEKNILTMLTKINSNFVKLFENGCVRFSYTPTIYEYGPFCLNNLNIAFCLNVKYVSNFSKFLSNVYKKSRDYVDFYFKINELEKNSSIYKYTPQIDILNNNLKQDDRKKLIGSKYVAITNFKNKYYEELIDKNIIDKNRKDKISRENEIINTLEIATSSNNNFVDEERIEKINKLVKVDKAKIQVDEVNIDKNEIKSLKANGSHLLNIFNNRSISNRAKRQFSSNSFEIDSSHPTVVKLEKKPLERKKDTAFIKEFKSFAKEIMKLLKIPKYFTHKRNSLSTLSYFTCEDILLNDDSGDFQKALLYCHNLIPLEINEEDVCWFPEDGIMQQIIDKKRDDDEDLEETDEESLDNIKANELYEHLMSEIELFQCENNRLSEELFIPTEFKKIYYIFTLGGEKFKSNILRSQYEQALCFLSTDALEGKPILTCTHIYNLIMENYKINVNEIFDEQMLIYIASVLTNIIDRVLETLIQSINVEDHAKIVFNHDQVLNIANTLYREIDFREQSSYINLFDLTNKVHSIETNKKHVENYYYTERIMHDKKTKIINPNIRSNKKYTMTDRISLIYKTTHWEKYYNDTDFSFSTRAIHLFKLGYMRVSTKGIVYEGEEAFTLYNTLSVFIKIPEPFMKKIEELNVIEVQVTDEVTKHEIYWTAYCKLYNLEQDDYERSTFNEYRYRIVPIEKYQQKKCKFEEEPIVLKYTQNELECTEIVYFNSSYSLLMYQGAINRMMPDYVLRSEALKQKTLENLILQSLLINNRKDIITKALNFKLSSMCVVGINTLLTRAINLIVNKFMVVYSRDVETREKHYKMLKHIIEDILKFSTKTYGVFDEISTKNIFDENKNDDDDDDETDDDEYIPASKYLQEDDYIVNVPERTSKRLKKLEKPKINTFAADTTKYKQEFLGSDAALENLIKIKKCISENKNDEGKKRIIKIIKNSALAVARQGFLKNGKNELKNKMLNDEKEKKIKTIHNRTIQEPKKIRKE